MMKMRNAAIILTAALTVLPVCAAVQAQEASWSDLASVVEQSGIEGDFAPVKDLGIQLWIPTALEEVELTEEDTNDGIVGYYESADGSSYVMIFTESDTDMAALREALEAEEELSDFEEGTINDLPMLSYDNKNADCIFASYQAPDGQIFTLQCGPASDEGFQQLASIVAASVMSTEDADAAETTDEEADTDETATDEAASADLGSSVETAISFDYHNIDTSVYDGAWQATGTGLDVYLPTDWEVQEITSEMAEAGVAFAAGEPGGGDNFVLNASVIPEGIEYTIDNVFTDLSAVYDVCYYGNLNGLPAVIFADDANNINGFCMVPEAGQVLSGVINTSNTDLAANVLISVSESETTEQ